MSGSRSLQCLLSTRFGESFCLVKLPLPFAVSSGGLLQHAVDFLSHSFLNCSLSLVFLVLLVQNSDDDNNYKKKKKNSGQLFIWHAISSQS